jgi:hypothetical protein
MERMAASRKATHSLHYALEEEPHANDSDANRRPRTQEVVFASLLRSRWQIV